MFCLTISAYCTFTFILLWWLATPKNEWREHCYQERFASKNIKKSDHVLHMKPSLILSSGVVNWDAFSEEHRRTYRTPYHISSCIQCSSLYKDCEGYRGYGHLLDTAALTVFMRLEALCTNLLIFYCYSIIICMLERIRLRAILLLFFYLSSVNLKALYMPVNKFSIQRIYAFSSNFHRYCVL